jgi:hypothetical protein
VADAALGALPDVPGIGDGAGAIACHSLCGAVFLVLAGSHKEVSAAEYVLFSAAATENPFVFLMLLPGSSMPFGVCRRLHDAFEPPQIPPLHPCEEGFHADTVSIVADGRFSLDVAFFTLTLNHRRDILCPGSRKVRVTRHFPAFLYTTFFCSGLPVSSS